MADGSPSGGASPVTNTPWPWRISTMPSIAMPFSASRTVERPTPSSRVSSRSDGTFVPGGSSRMAARSCSATVAVSLRRVTGDSASLAFGSSIEAKDSHPWQGQSSLLG